MAATTRCGARSFNLCGDAISEHVEERDPDVVATETQGAVRGRRVGPRALPARSPWWSATAAVALVAAAGWLRTPAVPYLAVCAAATAVNVALAIGQRYGGSRLAALGLALFCGLAASGQVAQTRIENHWSAVVTELTDRSTGAMDRELGALGGELQRAAAKALNAPPEPRAAFAWLAPLARGGAERSIVLERDGQPWAWAGTLRTPIDPTTRPFALIRTPFYLALQATVHRGRDRAVATALLHADPPADRLSDALDEQIADRIGIDGFAFTRPSTTRSTASDSGSAATPAVTIALGGAPLVAVRPIPPQQAETLQREQEVWGSRCALALGLALVVFMAVEWRARGRSIWRRLLALAVSLAALAIVPLNAFSNASRLFDATYFFSPVGGPYTASVGALGVTGAIALLAALTAARARVRLRPWWIAAAVGVAASASAPLAVEYVAGGITPPGAAVPLTLWVGWQIALALGATAWLTWAAVIARGALPSRRGLSSAWGVGLALAAAVAAPLLWSPPADWPAWYVVWWCGAAVAAAFARRSRWLVVSAALVAACGSSVVVWGTTAAKRTVLAERDLGGLAVPDPEAVALLERFGTELASEPPPTDRADLLIRYARSDLAAAGYPVRLALWWPDGRPRAALDLARFDSDTDVVAAIAADARHRDTFMVAQAAGAPGVQLILAVPSPGGAVTTVVLAPQTRLIAEYWVAPLLGLSTDAEVSPPYTISLLEVVPPRRPLLDLPAGDTLYPADSDARAASPAPASGAGRSTSGSGAATAPAGRRAAAAIASSTSRPGLVPVRWTRQGSQLHGDWLVPTSAGPARAHVEVQLRPFDALLQRGVLLVVADLLVVTLLWALSIVGDGVLGRWLRGHTRRWARSYRTQLTVVLFAFFVVPAVLFAVWSYRRLRSDDAEERALLAWQALRTVAAGGLDDLSADGDRAGTPIFLYESGLLRSASDSLYTELAPVGRLLRPDLYLGLGLGNEVRASRAEQLGTGRFLFGYRAVDAPGGDRVVLAAPARGDEAGLDTRRADLGVLVLFTTVLGAAAALGLSGLAARQFARPIDALRRAALAVADGEREPDLAGNPPTEFAPVFAAFRRMAADFGESQRVLAWGEMARQVAHEIKNPLTPIRLGVQHLQRARAAGRADFDRILDQNAGRILAEIDRLDQIARAFSRYGSAPDERAPAEPTDISGVARDVVELERLGAGGGITWGLTGADAPVTALARADELREVLLNVLENARLAGARHVRVRLAPDRSSVAAGTAPSGDGGRVTVTVSDDGEGIAPDVLPHIFEPHFSTRTSGSGLGLAVSRRIVDGWGGTVTVHSEPGQGTRVAIVLVLSTE